MKLINALKSLVFIIFLCSCEGRNIDFMLPENSIPKKNDVIKVFPYFVHVYDIGIPHIDTLVMYPRGCCNTCDNDCWVFYKTSKDFKRKDFIDKINRIAELSEDTQLNQLKENIDSGKSFLCVKYFDVKPTGPRGTFSFMIIDTTSKKLFFFEFSEKKWWL